MSKKNFNKVIVSVAKILMYLMPACLFLSYYPVISLGKSETMNFELSVPLIWLVVFDVVVLVAMAERRVLFSWLKNKRWLWLLFPVWVTLSLIWSVNVTRGVLTVGIMWLLFLAGYGMWVLRDLWDEEFRRCWWKWFIGSTLVVCVWCFVQCILDLVGVSQDYSLMCDGCTYHMFGFPHPNGFAIEPQFMGNLLLAPAIATMYLMIKSSSNNVFRDRVAPARLHGGRALRLGSSLRMSRKTLFAAALIIISTLFLTFSRGAIYAFLVGMVVMTVAVVVQEKEKRKKIVKRVWGGWGIVVCSFLLVLNLQGVMAQVGPTSDTYMVGVGKVINHMTLGVVKLPVEKPVENSEGNRGGNETGGLAESEAEEAIFGGYVAESTDTRLKLTGVSLERWSQDLRTAMFGVGIGGAGQALYDAELSPSPKEIVQNEYASLLLETGVVGVSLFALLVILAICSVWKVQWRWAVINLMVAYGISLLFFSGLANALQIYLFPILIIVLFL